MTRKFLGKRSCLYDENVWNTFSCWFKKYNPCFCLSWLRIENFWNAHQHALYRGLLVKGSLKRRLLSSSSWNIVMILIRFHDMVLLLKLGYASKVAPISSHRNPDGSVQGSLKWTARRNDTSHIHYWCWNGIKNITPVWLAQ